MSKLTERLETFGFRSREYSFDQGLEPDRAVEQIRREMGGFSLNALLGLAGSFYSYFTAPKLDDLQIISPEEVRKGNLVFIVHGIGNEHGGKFRRLQDLGNTENRNIVPLTYDDNVGFDKYSFQVLDDMNRLADGAGAENVFAIGHSTGADILRYLSSKRKLDSFRGVVLAAPTTNGHVPGVREKLAGYYSKTDYHNPHTKEGRRVIGMLREPLTIPGITVCYKNDFLVPTKASLDMNPKARNLVVDGMGHLMGTGNHKKGNILYLEVLRDLEKK